MSRSIRGASAEHSWSICGACREHAGSILGCLGGIGVASWLFWGRMGCGGGDGVRGGVKNYRSLLFAFYLPF